MTRRRLSNLLRWLAFIALIWLVLALTDVGAQTDPPVTMPTFVVSPTPTPTNFEGALPRIYPETRLPLIAFGQRVVLN